MSYDWTKRRSTHFNSVWFALRQGLGAIAERHAGFVLLGALGSLRGFEALSSWDKIAELFSTVLGEQQIQDGLRAPLQSKVRRVRV